MTLENNCDPENLAGINQSAWELRHIPTGQKINENGRPDDDF